jgi:hypothetical protein
MFMNVNVHGLLLDLSSDRREGLVQLAAKVEKLSLQKLSNEDRAVLCKCLEAYARKYSVLSFPKKDATTNWENYLGYMLRSIDRIGFEVRLDRYTKQIDTVLEEVEELEKAEQPFGYAFLSPEEKATIHKTLDKIRKIIEASNLTLAKKRALYSRLNNLSKEVDQDGTRSDAFFSFAIDISMLVAQLEKNGRPAINHVKDILKIIFRARAENEGSSLPSPEDFPLLPPTPM